MYTITKEQLREAAKNPETLKGLFPDAFKVELEEGRWYKDEYPLSDKWLICLTKLIENGFGYCYGTKSNGEWINDCRSFDNMIEATHEEVTELLKSELVKRYGEDWENVNIKKCLEYGDGDKWVNKGDYSSVIYIDRPQIWNRNGCIFKDGVWAEKLEDVKPKKELQIKEGERYICRKDVILSSGEILFVRGKVYSSNCDYNLINERDFNNYIDPSHAYKHFLKLPQ